MPDNEVVIAAVVQHPRPRAFRLFTESIDSWWHRTEGTTRATITLDGQRLSASTGGHVETIATVTNWDPPAGIELDWQGPHGEPGDHVLIEFEDLGPTTKVTIRHRRVGLTPASAAAGALGLWWADGLRSVATVDVT